MYIYIMFAFVCVTHFILAMIQMENKKADTLKDVGSYASYNNDLDLTKDIIEV